MLCRLSYPRIRRPTAAAPHSSDDAGSCAVPASTSAWQFEHRSTRLLASARHVQRTGHALAREGERLLGRIEVVKVQTGQRPVVAAQQAFSARLLYQDPLQ